MPVKTCCKTNIPLGDSYPARFPASPVLRQEEYEPTIAYLICGLRPCGRPPRRDPPCTEAHPTGEVDILVNGAAQRRYAHDGRWYVEARKGREYAIRLRNPYRVRVAVALSVDGLNTIDARETTAVDARKWVLGPYETVTISGWQTSQPEARRFEFTTEAQSYGQALGKTANLGVISAVFFKERVPTIVRRKVAGSQRAPGRPRRQRRRSDKRPPRREGEEGRRRVRGHRDGPPHGTRRRAGVAEPRRHTRADGEHPLRIRSATGQARHPAFRSYGRSAAAPRARARLRAGLLPRTTAPAVSAMRVGRGNSVGSYATRMPIPE